MANKYIFTKVYIIGSGQLAFSCAEIVREYIADVKVFELKVTDSTTLEKLCNISNIPYRSVSSQELTHCLLQEEDEILIVSAASTYIVPEKIIGKANYYIINWHNALLPNHKGRNAEVWTIYEGDRHTGVTWHNITKDIDAGAIIRQERIEINEKITAMMLYREQVALGEKMFGEFCEALLKGECEVSPQVEMKESKIHYAKDVPNNGMLNLDWDIEQISRFLRSMDYGSLLLMGKMKLTYQGTTYEFYRYSIRHTDEWLSERCIALKADKIDIREEDKQIILKGLQEIE